MTYTSRILPVDEWPKLADTELASVVALLKPDDTQVIVVEQGAQIVGVWLAVRMVHAEGVWIDPAHRGAFGVVKRLLRGLRTAAQAWGVDVVWTGAREDDALVQGLIAKLGGEALPFTSFRLPMGGVCQRS